MISARREYYPHRKGAEAVKIIADLHTHTTYSHGKGTVLENVTAALTKGLRAVGITDHGPRMAPWVRTSVRDFRKMRREVTEVDSRVQGIKVLAGAECNISSARGDLDVPHSIRRGLDIVLAGLHPGILPNSGSDWMVLYGGNWAARFSTGLRRRARVNNTKAVVDAVRRNDVDVITHPGYHLDIDTVELARVCAARDTALEINAHHHEMTPEFCRAAAKAGCKFVIDSDAHKPADVGNLERGIKVAEAAGLRPEQVLNSDGGGLFAWLERKKGRRTGPALGRNDRTSWADWSEQQPADRAGKHRTDDPPERGGRSTWSDWTEQGGKVH
jgi:putative hydrolase